MLKETKEIFDQIHGYIKITKLAQIFIHTVQFQRLRYLHQLGTCHYVFPSATHTRFEHSVGTYFLAGKAIESIKKNTDETILSKYLYEIPELKKHFHDSGYIRLDHHITELIKIAALCHDIGHGPFSHVFDDIFMSSVTTGKPEELHEIRSCNIIRYIRDNNKELQNFISEDEINFVCNLINPKKEDTNFIYQIVSNNLNGIDVDKFDYIQRDTYTLGLKYSIDANRIISDMKVIDNKICYSSKVYYDIVSVFTTRYRLHKQIYTHKTVISTQYMINDIILILNKVIDIYNSIFSVVSFTDLTEEYIFTVLKLLYRRKNELTETEKSNIEYAYNLWIRLNERDLYQLVASLVTDSKIENLDYQDHNVIFYQTKIGFVSGSKENPLDNVYFYSHKDNPEVCYKITKDISHNSSHLISDIYQEYITMFFLKDKNDLETKYKLKKTIDFIYNKVQ